MPLIEWNSSLSVGVEAIDEQHRKWIEIINELDESLTMSKGPDTLKKTVKDMEDYVNYHFAEEEKLMEGVKYPEIDHHKDIHEGFRNQIQKLKNDIYSGDMVLRTQVMSLLKNWLMDHIMSEDRKYSKFVYPFH